MRAARAEAVREAEAVQRDTSGRSLGARNAEAAAARARESEARQADARRAAEEVSRTRAEEDKLYQSISATNDKAAQLTAQFGRLSGSRAGSLIAGDIQKAEVRLAQARARAQELQRELEKPASARGIENVGNAVAVAERRITRLTAELKELDKQAARAERRGGADPFTPGGGGPSAQPNRVGGLSTAVGFAGSQLNLPPGLGSLTTALQTGGGVAALGGVAFAAAGVAQLVSLSNDAERAQFDLAVSARDTGRSFVAARADADTFAEGLKVSREEAGKVAAAFGELQLKTGDALKPDAGRQLSELARARGLDAEATAATLRGLSRGSTDSFEQLTGSRGDLALDRYARSINTTTGRLTDMQRAQALTNEALRLSANYTRLAAERNETFEGRTKSLTASLKDFASEYARAFVEGVVLNRSAEETYQAELARQGGSGNEEARAANARRDEEATVARQQELRNSQERVFRDVERDARALPESYGSGLNAVEAAQSSLQRLRERRALLQAELEAFRAIRAQFSTEDAERFETQFRDSIQSLTDQVRGQVEAMAADARGKVQALARDIRDSGEEFTRLRLPTDEANPYVKLFADGERAAERARERFALLGNEAVAAYEKASRAALDARRYDLQVKDSMSAVRLEFEAAELARPFDELTGAMKRTLSVFTAELQAAGRLPALQQSAELVRLRNQYRNGFAGNPDALSQAGFNFDKEGQLQANGDFLAGREVKNLLALRERFGDSPGRAGEQIREQLNSRLTEIYSGLSPGALREVTSSPQLTDTFARAYDEQAEFQNREVERAARAARLSAPSLRLAQTQLAELQRLSTEPGANRDRTRAEFLAITGAIPREELSPELAAGRIESLREEAAFTRAREQRAEEAYKETRDFQRALIGENGKGGRLNELLAAIKDRQERIIVEVLDRSNSATVSTLGGGFQ